MRILIKKYKALICISISLFLLVSLTSALHERFQNEQIYREAIGQIRAGEYQSAIDRLRPLKFYQETQRYITYAEALLLLDEGYPEDAAGLLETLGEFEDSNQKADEIRRNVRLSEEYERVYQEIVTAYQDRRYQTVIEKFAQLGDYKDSKKFAEEAKTNLWRLEQANTLAAGIQCSAGVTTEGEVLFSGRAFSEEEEISAWKNIVSVSACNEFLAGLQHDGTVVTAKRKSQYGYRIDTSDWKDMIAVSVGEQFIVGLRKDGTLTAQGIDGYGETDIDAWENIVSIDTGWQHTVALDRDGRVYATGFHSEELLREITERQEAWTGIVDIATGGSTAQGSKGSGHIVGLKKDGTVVAAGDNSFGQCEVSQWRDIVAIDAGDYHTVGLKRDGTVLTTQTKELFRESCAEISQWTDIVGVAAGYGFTLGLCEDGTVKAAGLNQNGQCDVAAWQGVQDKNEWLTDR